MYLKILICVFACISLIQGLNVGSRIRRQSNEGSRFLSGFTQSNNQAAESFAGNRGNYVNDENQLEQGRNVRSELNNRVNGNGFLNGFGIGNGFGSEIGGGFVNRARSALENTYQDQRNSVQDSVNALGNFVRSGIEARTNLTKTSYDLALTAPQIGRNYINSN